MTYEKKCACPVGYALDPDDKVSCKSKSTSFLDFNHLAGTVICDISKACYNGPVLSHYFYGFLAGMQPLHGGYMLLNVESY